jgi:uncharacterized RDD family membrane protein YckC
MQCVYCQAWNEQDERRCVRCGRRLRAPAPRPAPDTYPLTSAAAPALQALPGGQRQPSAPRPEVSYQPSLFRDAAGGPKVIPIPTLAPAKSPPEARRARGPSEGRTQAPRANLGARRGSDSQQSLDFRGAAGSSPLGTEVEAVIYCDAPVALPVHRLMAAAVDGSMILMAMALFTAIFYLSGGHITVSRQTAPLLAGVVAAIAVFYRLLWCLADGDTPGMRFAGLRLVNFDGRRPDRDQRSVRQAAYLLSLLSAGLGLVWALVDEENLTWHDHISKTFPTPG